MANNLKNFVMQNLAQGLVVLRNNCGLTKSLSSKFETISGGVSSTVDIPYTYPGVVSDVVPSVNPPAAQDSNTGMIQLVVDRWKMSDFYVTDKQFDELQPDYFTLRTQQACTDLAEYVNGDIWGMYKEVYNCVGTPGINPFANDDAAVLGDAAKMLTDNKASTAGRAGILNTAAYYKAVTNKIFAQAYSSDDTKVMGEAELGRKFGFDWYYDQQAAKHVAGTAVGYQVAALGVVGSTTVTIGSGTGSFVVGDVFTVAGDAQQYVVNSAVGTTLGFAPMAKTAFAAGAAISKLASHAVNLIYHRDAFAFATRPLLTPGTWHEKLGKITTQMHDEVSGFSLGLEISSQNKQIRWEYSLMYGMKVIRAELAARMLG